MNHLHCTLNLVCVPPTIANEIEPNPIWSSALYPP